MRKHGFDQGRKLILTPMPASTMRCHKPCDCSRMGGDRLRDFASFTAWTRPLNCDRDRPPGSKTAIDHSLSVQFEDSAASKTAQQPTQGDHQTEAGGTIPVF